MADQPKIKDEFEDIIGLDEHDAKDALKKMGIPTVRTRERNGKHFVGTMDIRKDRVNIHIEDDVVIRAYRG
jgi:hypothetical protein